MCGPPISQSAWMVRRRTRRSRYSSGIFRKSFGSTLAVNWLRWALLLRGHAGVELAGLVGREDPLGGAHVLLDLLRRDRPRDDRRDDRPRQEPRDGQIADRFSALRGKRLKPLERVEAGVGQP